MKPTPFIHAYFNVEQLGAMMIFFIGLMAFTGAGYFLFFSSYSDFYKGVSWPLLIVSVIQIGIGAYLYIRTPNDIVRVELFFNEHPDKLITEELPRMKKVLSDFVFYIRFQVTLCIIGVLMVIFTQSKSNLLMGIGLGILIQGGVMLMFDYLAERRAAEYTRQLEQVIKEL